LVKGTGAGKVQDEGCEPKDDERSEQEDEDEDGREEVEVFQQDCSSVELLVTK
jgi:hypothetical protein